MHMLLRYLRPYFKKMSFGFVIKFIGTIMDLLLPWILAYIIDRIIPEKNIRSIMVWGVAMIVCSILAMLFNIAANRMAATVARNTTLKLRHDLFCKIFSLSCSQLDHFTVPSLISRLTSDTYNIHQMVGMMQRMGVRAPILLIGGILVTLSLEPVLALILIATLPIIAFVIIIISKKGIPLYKNLQQGVDRFVRTVRENIVGIRMIKALSKTEYEKKRFDAVNNDVVEREKRAVRTMAITNPSMNMLLNIGLTLVIIVGAYRVNAGVSQAGKIIAFMTYFTIILNAMLSINRLFAIYSKAIASAERICEVFDTPEDLALRSGAHSDTSFHVVFNHVSFSYQKGENHIIHDISFQLRKGETLGIIGATGSGKTTIINLLMRLYEINQGSILIDGEPIDAIPSDILHTKFGVVFQNDVFFADTIAENISFGRKLTRSELEHAAQCAQASEFIDALSDGFEYELAIKAANLSGGQKQRLLIARALAAQPEILILDDCSSALDYKTDAELRLAIQKHFENTTTIIIAQRISSIMHADHILVLEDGKSIGYGTHEELMQSCNNYREISLSQMGGVPHE